LAKDHNDKEVHDQALDRLRHGEQYKDGAWWVENVEALQRAERRYGKLLPKAKRIMIKGKESTVENINSGRDGGTLGLRLKRLRRPLTLALSASPASNLEL
jgi:hypothetical protein